MKMSGSRSSDESDCRPDELPSEEPVKPPSKVADTSLHMSAHVLSLRWKNTFALVYMQWPVAMLIGGSPLVDYMNGNTEYRWLAPGVTQPALGNFAANVLIQQLVGNLIPRLSPCAIFLASLTSLASPASIAISTYPGMVPIQYLGAVIGGLGFAIALQYQPAVMQWWSLDERKIDGAVIVGMLLGSQFMACNLILSSLLSSLGLAGAMYGLMGIMAASGIFPMWLAIRGELGCPERILATAGSTVTGATTKGVSAAHAATKLWATREFWHLCFHTAAYPFTGFGMKALTTSIFHVSYGTSFLESSHLSALSLVGFMVVRAVSPMVVNRLPVLVLVTALLSVNAFLFVLYPTIVVTCSTWVLLLAKTVATGNFAGIQAVQVLLIMKVLGAANLGRASASLGTATFIGFAAGPLVGQYTQMLTQTTGEGKPAYESFFPFFYVCAALAALGVINLLCLGIGLSREKETHTETSTPNEEIKGEQSSEAV